MVGEEKLSDKTMHSLEKRILVDELHAPARRNFKRRRVVVKGYDDLWQADIVAPSDGAPPCRGGGALARGVLDLSVPVGWLRAHQPQGLRPSIWRKEYGYSEPEVPEFISTVTLSPLGRGRGRGPMALPP